MFSYCLRIVFVLPSYCLRIVSGCAPLGRLSLRIPSPPNTVSLRILSPRARVHVGPNTSAATPTDCGPPATPQIPRRRRRLSAVRRDIAAAADSRRPPTPPDPALPAPRTPPLPAMADSPQLPPEILQLIFENVWPPPLSAPLSALPPPAARPLTPRPPARPAVGPRRLLCALSGLPLLPRHRRPLPLPPRRRPAPAVPLARGLRRPARRALHPRPAARLCDRPPPPRPPAAVQRALRLRRVRPALPLRPAQSVCRRRRRRGAGRGRDREHEPAGVVRVRAGAPPRPARYRLLT